MFLIEANEINKIYLILINNKVLIGEILSESEEEYKLSTDFINVVILKKIFINKIYYNQEDFYNDFYNENSVTVIKSVYKNQEEYYQDFYNDFKSIDSEKTKELKNENLKIHEYNLGIATSIYYPIKIIKGLRITSIFYYSEYTDEFIFSSIRKDSALFPAQYREFGFGIKFNYSYLYRIKQNISVGLNIQIGYSPILFYDYSPELSLEEFNNAIFSKIALKVKSGSLKSNFSFIYELGAILNFNIPFYPLGNILISSVLEYNYWEANLYIHEHYYPAFSFGLGPIMFFGFSYSKENYNFEFGGFFSLSVGNNVYSNIEMYNIEVIPFGIEFRWNYIMKK